MADTPQEVQQELLPLRTKHAGLNRLEKEEKKNMRQRRKIFARAGEGD
jgi:hypothetical protein